MSFQFLRPDDSDGDSWLEILEGSPGPSLQGSPLQGSPSFVAVSSTESLRFGLDMDESSPGSDRMQGPEEAPFEKPSLDDSDSHQPNPAHDNSSDNQITPPIEIIRRDPTQKQSPFPSSSLQISPLSVGRPEIGDIVGHYRAVYGKLLTTGPDKADCEYYQNWLQWLYRMKWDEIQALVFNAPECVVQAANYSFGLRNHPFWTVVKSGWRRRSEWNAMRAACSDVLSSWWTDCERAGNMSPFLSSFAQNRLPSGSSVRNTVDLENQAGDMAGNEVSGVAALDEIEVYYNTSRQEDEEMLSSSSSTVLRRSNIALSLPGQPQQVIDYVKRKYQSFNGPEEPTGNISFETWINWNQNKGGCSSKYS